MLRFHVVRAVFKRDFVNYFSNPTGYVFITIFVVACAVANVVWGNTFFADNLATLDQLNTAMPFLLLFFVPAITMSLWADEKKQGTDELLLTLPANDMDIVLGKYLAALGIYTVALLFSLSNVLVLTFLGSPDGLLMFSNYLGYWLLGAALLATGMVGSLLSFNATVGFIFGAVLCAVPVLAPLAHESLRAFGTAAHLEGFGIGRVELPDVAYFVLVAVVMLYLNVVLLGRRHWSGGKDGPNMWAHYAVRTIAVVAVAAALAVIAARSSRRIDLTAEKLHTIAPQTEKLLAQLDPKKPVRIQAFVSKDVPRDLVQPRLNLLNMLREFDAKGGDAVQVRIVDAEQYQPSGKEAEEVFGIKPRTVIRSERGRYSEQNVYLGFAVSSGAEEEVTAFLDPGLSAEYELIRSISVVSRSKRKKIGILDNGLKLFGGFDFQTRRMTPKWSIVSELKKQYRVVPVPPDSAYPDDLDVLVVILPSLLSQPQMDKLGQYLRQGKPTLLLVDPVTYFNLDYSAKLPAPQSSGFMGRRRPSPPKGSIRGLLAEIGVGFAGEDVVFDRYNPLSKFQGLPPEFVFVDPGAGSEYPFNPDDLASKGLERVLMLFPGRLRQVPTSGRLKFKPLLRSGKRHSGIIKWDKVIRREFFVGTQILPGRVHIEDAGGHVLAAKITGEFPENAVPTAEGKNKDEQEKPPSAKPTEADVIVAADVDMISEGFFNMRRQSGGELTFDNITFVLNCIDELAGDTSFIELRKHRRRHRTLTTFEEMTDKYEQQRQKAENEARAEAERKLKEASAQLKKQEEAVDKRTDLKAQERREKKEWATAVAERRFKLAKEEIESEKKRRVTQAKAEKARATEKIENWIKEAAVLLPPIPALILGVIVLLLRRRRERVAVGAHRLL